ncbi:unnamed protein product [Rangifer tarandus platyrhynchus]|uniref:Uncharacterized protein n=1 Tax=Rangifer tarandus platyrhynchus TaxID=3082113 RepID=A0AC60A0Y6_RANTA
MLEFQLSPLSGCLGKQRSSVLRPPLPPRRVLVPGPQSGAVEDGKAARFLASGTSAENQTCSQEKSYGNQTWAVLPRASVVKEHVCTGDRQPQARGAAS